MIDIRRLLDNIKTEIEKTEYYYENTIKEVGNRDTTTLWFFEKAVIRIRWLKKSTRIELKTEFGKDLELQAYLTQIKSDQSWSKAEYSDDVAKRITANAYKVYEKCYLDVPEPFGCCSKFLECSDLRGCVLTDKALARECIYKRHLEGGRIFYGVNRNVP